MAEAVVGVLRALLTADTAQFDTGMRKAAQTTQAFGKEVQKLTPQAERMAKAFSGDRLLQQANNLTAAITKVGGASRLTAQEQERVNRTLTDAIAKYRALGQQAPAAMLNLQRATQQTQIATTKFGVGLGQLRTIAAGFGVTLGVGTVAAFGREILKTADALVRVADRTGLTTTEVQKLQFIAEQSGNSIEDFTAAIGQLQNRLAGGDAGAIKALEFLKINLQALKTAAPFEQLSMLAKAIAAVEDPLARARVQVLLFGRAGLTILPSMIAEFEKLGNAAPIMSDRTVRALDEAGDALNLFGRTLTAVAAEAFVSFSRQFDRLIISIRRNVARVTDAMAAWFEMLSRLPIVGAMYASIAEQFRAFAQSQTLAADAHVQMLERQQVEVRKNTGALVDYDALLSRTAESTKKVKDATADLLPLLHEYFRTVKTLAPAIEDNNAAQTEYNNLIAIGLEDMVGMTEATRQQNEELRKRGVLLQAPSVEMDRPGDQPFEPQEIEGHITDLRQQIADIGRFTVMSISDALTESLVRLRGFKQAWLDIWDSIRRGFAQILASMLDTFIGSFLKGLLQATGIAKIGQTVGNALLGGATGAAIGGGAAASGAGVGTAAAAGGGGALGFLANPGFWTNPFTIAAAAGIVTGLLVWKKGLFRGGEEGVKVNPRRDKFLAQFGDQSNKGVGGAAHNLATLLVGRTGSDMPLQALQRADTVKEFEAAQAGLVSILARLGKRVQSFQFGGFIPPGMVQPAILHGGAFGEDILPRGRGNASGHRTVNVYIQGVLDRDSVREVMREHVWPEFNREMQLNQFGGAASVRKTR